MIGVATAGNARGEEAGNIRPAVEVVEILVPGLGPVDRDALLRPTDVHRITGDNKAGLYRSVEPENGLVEFERHGPAVQLVREVYDWTRLTIGGASRALWLFLLPFLLVNLVAWMQPRWPCGKDKLHTKAAGAVYEFGARLLALSLTVLVVGTFGQVAMDQFAWQCAPRAVPGGVCASGNQAVRMLEQLSGPQVGLVAAAALPAVVVFVLLFFARDSRQEYLPVKPTVSAGQAEKARRKRTTTGEDGHPLELPGFWEHNRRDPGIAAQHVWAGLLTTAALLTWTPMHEDPPGSVRKTFGVLLFAIILVMALVVVMCLPWLHTNFGLTLRRDARRRKRLLELCHIDGKEIQAVRPVRPWHVRITDRLRGRAGDKRSEPVAFLPLWPTRYPVFAGICCALVTVAAVIYCLWPGREWTVSGQLPGILVQSTSLLVAQGLGVLLLVIGALCLPVRTAVTTQTAHKTSFQQRRHMALYGLAGPATAVAACFVGWLYTDAVAQWTSSWLAPSDGPGPVIPEPAQLMGMLLVPLLIGAVGMWALIAVVMRLLPVPPPGEERGCPTLAELLRAGSRSVRALLGAAWIRTFGGGEEEPREDLSKDEQRHLQSFKKARRRHYYLMREVDWLLAFVALLIVFFVVAYYCHLGIRKSQEGARNLVYDVLGTASVPMLAGLAALMLLAFRTLALRPDTRQNAGLAWAFGAFWPRAVHPFAPPSWTVRAVPEFVWRLKSLLEEKGTDRRILIRANSMGSVLVLAAVWQLKGSARGRIALLTTGCPVRTYFTRHYPGFVCADSIGCLAPGGGGKGALAGWINVWRDTDPLGGPVELNRVDERWPDSGEDQIGTDEGKHERTRDQPVFPPIEGHRGYTTDGRLLDLRRGLVRRLLERDEAAGRIPPETAPSADDGRPEPAATGGARPTAEEPDKGGGWP